MSFHRAGGDSDRDPESEELLPCPPQSSEEGGDPAAGRSARTGNIYSWWSKLQAGILKGLAPRCHGKTAAADFDGKLSSTPSFGKGLMNQTFVQYCR